MSASCLFSLQCAADIVLDRIGWNTLLARILAGCGRRQMDRMDKHGLVLGIWVFFCLVTFTVSSVAWHTASVVQ